MTLDAKVAIADLKAAATNILNHVACLEEEPAAQIQPIGHAKVIDFHARRIVSASDRFMNEVTKGTAAQPQPHD